MIYPNDYSRFEYSKFDFLSIFEIRALEKVHLQIYSIIRLFAIFSKCSSILHSFHIGGPLARSTFLPLLWPRPRISSHIQTRMHTNTNTTLITHKTHTTHTYTHNTHQTYKQKHTYTQKHTHGLPIRKKYRLDAWFCCTYDDMMKDRRRRR